MPVFKYEARARDGKTLVKKSLEAKSYADVYNALLKNGLTPVKITEVEKGQVKSSIRKLTLKDVAIFCRQFSTMLTSGVTLVKAFDIMRNQAQASNEKNLYLIYNSIYLQIQQGESLYEAIKSLGNVFPPMLINMIRAGEVSGSLDTVMEKTADYFFAQNKLQNKIKTGTTYPKFLAGLIVAIVLLLFGAVLPSFFVVFDEMGIELPKLTLIVMAISNFVTGKWYIIAAVIGFSVITYNILMSNPKIALDFDEAKLSMPVLKNVIIKVAIANFSSTMAVLYSSGVDMLETLQISVSVLNNKYYDFVFKQIIGDVENGKILSAAMEDRKVFEPMIISMIAIGEESGNLEQILEKATEFYENEAEEAIARMIAVAEPVMIIIIGIVVLAIVAAVMLPAAGLASGIGESIN